MGNVKFTILTAVYNAEKYLGEALDSVLAQTLTSWQMICVDDASTDQSLAILQRYANKDKRIEVLQKTKNEGQAVARNEALALAKGEYITMLDADDWLSPDCLEQVLKAFREGTSEEADCVVMQLMQHYSDREELYPIPYAVGSDISGREAFEASLDWQLHGLYAIKRDIHLRFPYDTSCRLYSDDNTTRLHYLHSRRVRISTATYHYRKHPKSSTNAITPARFLHMEANISMRQTLLSEGVGQDVLDKYEYHRWLNYIGMHWIYYQNKHLFSAEEQQYIQQLCQKAYNTFHRPPTPAKFGCVWFPSYQMFRLQTTIYFFLRSIWQRASKKHFLLKL